jgi:uncharacterized membrane protein required for colicin V production
MTIGVCTFGLPAIWFALGTMASLTAIWFGYRLYASVVPQWHQRISHPIFGLVVAYIVVIIAFGRAAFKAFC